MLLHIAEVLQGKKCRSSLNMSDPYLNILPYRGGHR